LNEADDDELSCAYYAANTPPDGSVVYDRATFARAYARGAVTIYRRQHVERLVAMVGKAVGLKPHGLVMRLLSPVVWTAWRLRARSLTRAAA